MFSLEKTVLGAHAQTFEKLAWERRSMLILTEGNQSLASPAVSMGCGYVPIKKKKKVGWVNKFGKCHKGDPPLRFTEHISIQKF